MKKFFRSLIIFVLTRQVKRLRARHKFKVIGVVGSIGKTSTKMAIAQALGGSLRVRYQHGNYNDLVTVPLVYFGHELAGLFNPVFWFRTFRDNNRQIKGDFPYDLIVLELGTDGPGQIANFARYGQLDVAVVTAITPEHMDSFLDLNAVASEELAVSAYADQLFYNSDLVASGYKGLMHSGGVSYSIKDPEADYRLANIFHSANGLEADVKRGEEIVLHISHEVVSEVQLYSVLASIVCGRHLGIKSVDLIDGIKAITPVSGRLRRLRGINNSLIIDDSYNASPEAVRSGLEMLYGLESNQKIAVLGNMNELGGISEEAHRAIGEMCDPSKLNMVITIGPDANMHLAAAAEARGCKVFRFDDPYSIGDFLLQKIESGAVIFFKGSQNGVFVEEAIKKVLADPEDSVKLVRQSDYWLRLKIKQFNKVKKPS